MNRRAFSTTLAGAAASALLPRLLAEQPTAALPSVSEQAAKLYRSALTLDCNCAPPLQDTLPLPQSTLDLARNSGVSVIKFTLAGINESFADTVDDLAWVQHMIEVHPAYFLQVRTPADMQRAKSEGKMGIILSFESADMLEGKVERLETFRNLGVRVMQLSYNRKSPFAAGIMEPDGGGLTPLGHTAVKKMNDVGIAVDLSHASPPEVL